MPEINLDIEKVLAVFEEKRKERETGDNKATNEEIMKSYVKGMDKERDLIKEFDSKIKLDLTDWSFMTIALGLQVARQMLSQYITNNRISDKQNADFVKKNLPEIFTTPVPYDTTIGGGKNGLDLDLGGGNYHRIRTLGHDPILGLFFGTINIATDTLTPIKYNKMPNICCVSYSVSPSVIGNRNYQRVLQGDPKNFVDVFNDAVKKFDGDKIFLGGCLLRQISHSFSDVFSETSIPIPCIGIFNEIVNNSNKIDVDIVQKFLKDNKLDTFRLGTEVASFGLASLINYIVEFTYLGMKYSPDEQDSKFNKVKAKKIISIANVLASSSNIVLTAMSGNLTKLDFGGITATLIHLFKSADFIENIKREFVTNNLFAMYDAELEEIKKRVDSYNIV